MKNKNYMELAKHLGYEIMFNEEECVSFHRGYKWIDIAKTPFDIYIDVYNFYDAEKRRTYITWEEGLLISKTIKEKGWEEELDE